MRPFERPFFQSASRAPALPTGAVVPDLAVKRSLVLDKFVAQRAQQRGAAVQRDRLQQQARSYAGAEFSRLTGDWTAMGTSADSEILTSLRALRARSRQLVRDNPFAKHAVRLITNNVIGQGIGLQGQVKSGRGKLQTAVNDSIENAWADWSCKATCHTAGLLGFPEIERLAMVQLVTAGEVIIRKIRRPFGSGTIPLALEVIEADRLLDAWQTARAPNGNAIRMGVEVDSWGRPVAYWFSPHHPGDYQFATFEPSKYLRVDAADIIHLYIVERWPQTRGEPWFHAVVRNLHDQAGYEESLIVKSRAAANIVGFIRSPELTTGDGVQNGRQIVDTEPGTWTKLLPGEDVAGFNGMTPDPSVEPFLRYMLRKMAVGVGTSYESLSRDYSQSNYSSSRMALLDDRDLYRVLQGFVIRNLRWDIHREFLDAAVLVGKVKAGADYYSNPAKYQAVKFKPRGWSWIDPQKEVAAYKMAVRNGFMTQGDVIAQTSPDSDVEDVMKNRREELDMAAELELVFDSDPLQVNDKGQAQPLPAATEVEGGKAEGEPPEPNPSAPAEPGAEDTSNDRDQQ
jgi:lambda family phage portal protein